MKLCVAKQIRGSLDSLCDSSLGCLYICSHEIGRRCVIFHPLFIFVILVAVSICAKCELRTGDSWTLKPRYPEVKAGVRKLMINQPFGLPAGLAIIFWQGGRFGNVPPAFPFFRAAEGGSESSSEGSSVWPLLANPWCSRKWRAPYQLDKFGSTINPHLPICHLLTPS